MSTEGNRPLVTHLMVPEIKERLESKRSHEVRKILEPLHPAEVADLLMELSPHHRAVTFRLLARDFAAEVFTELPADASVRGLVQKRLGWLLVLVFVNMISATVIETYEETLAAIIALAFFVPLLIDSGGNTGSQSATIMVRAIATWMLNAFDMAAPAE